MLQDPQIQKLMKQIASGILPAEAILEVRSQPTSDPDGHDALKIMLILSEDATDILTGKELAMLLSAVRDSLLDEGDERFPMLSFATPSDLEAFERGED